MGLLDALKGLFAGRSQNEPHCDAAEAICVEGTSDPSMKLFKLVADCEFQAENIDDAFERLGKYFLAISQDSDPQPLLVGGKININPLGEERPFDMEEVLRDIQHKVGTLYRISEEIAKIR